MHILSTMTLCVVSVCVQVSAFQFACMCSLGMHVCLHTHAHKNTHTRTHTHLCVCVRAFIYPLNSIYNDPVQYNFYYARGRTMYRVVYNSCFFHFLEQVGSLGTVQDCGTPKERHWSATMLGTRRETLPGVASKYMSTVSNQLIC